MLLGLRALLQPQLSGALRGLGGVELQGVEH